MISFIAGGGAAEIGASFYVLRLGDTFIGVDCGFRPTAANHDPWNVEKIMPNFDVCPKLDYLFLTHGHLDHVGAAPCLLERFKNLRIFTTEPTKFIALAQWHETLKIAERDKTPPPFSGDSVHSIASKIRVLEVNSEKNFGEFSVTAIPAGHILGAVSLLFNYKGKRIFFSGDISFQDQELIKGAKHDFQVDYLISEATYAGKSRRDRREERDRFLGDVRQIINNRGRVLIPSFSIGRAQEIFEMLRKSDIAGLAPIYIDGAARSMTDIHQVFLPHKINRHVNKHYVENVAHRLKIFEQKPCVVIASSGMLSGGASVGYARNWLGQEENAILFPGYIDPFSPGYAVLTTDHGDSVALPEKNRTIRAYIKRCRTDQYHLSAHADQSELLMMRETLNPQFTILVHGEPEDMEKMIAENALGSIFTPKNGEEIVLE